MSIVANSAPPLDLSKLAKLKEVVLGCGGPSVQWIVITLQTAESINLEQITIRWSTASGTSIAESVHREWQDLDRVLLQFWISRSIRPKIGYWGGVGGRDSFPAMEPKAHTPARYFSLSDRIIAHTFNIGLFA